MWPPAAGLAFVECGQCLNFLIVDLEVEDLEVLPDTLRMHGFWEDHVAAFDVPAQHHLGRMYAEGLGDPDHHRVTEHRAACDGRPALGDDVVFGAVGADLIVGEVRMHLDLIDRGDGLGLPGQFLQVVETEVRHANAACPAVGFELLQGLPGGDEVAVVECGQRPVDQEQIDVVEA